MANSPLDTAFALDVAVAETREQALARVLRRKILMLYKTDSSNTLPVQHLAGTSQEITAQFADVLADAEQTLQEVEDAIVADVKIFSKELIEQTRIRAKKFAESDQTQLEASTHIYRHIRTVDVARNAYLLPQVPELQGLIDEINSTYGADGVKAEIRIVERFLSDGKTKLGEEIRLILTKSPV